jgi:hypothetical protein
LTVGLREILVRFENLKIRMPREQLAAVERIQRIRNRIEHHRYDHNEKQHDLIIAEALKVVLFFNEFILRERLGAELFSRMQHRVVERAEREGLANHRLDEWMKKQWPEWHGAAEDMPEEFSGALDCPLCRHSFFCGWLSREAVLLLLRRLDRWKCM